MVGHTIAVHLAWLVFAAGAGQYYLFRITGKYDFGDLIGGAQIGLFVVYVESVRLALRVEGLAAGVAADEGVERTGTVRRAVLVTLFAVQVGCGIFLLVHELTAPAQWW
jgi:hypothetical protein